MANPYGRRGLPPEGDGPEPQPAAPPPRTGARRAVPLPASERGPVPIPVPATRPSSGGARRGLQPEDSGPDRDSRRAWFAVAVLPLLIAAVVGVLWLVFGERGDGGSVALPAPSSASEVEPATADPAEEPSAEPNEQPNTPDETDPGSEAPTQSGPAPAPAESPQLPTGPEEEPSPVSSTPSGVRLELNGAVLDMPPGWQLYADELVQDQRRLVRIRELTTDVRIQAVSLTNVTGPLDQACLDLMTDHRQLFTGVAEGLPVTVPISGEGQGVSCNFTGTRASDGVANQVEFTLLQLGTVTLVFRDTVPTTVPEDSPALAQLVSMECAASESFGITVNQCALTPGQGGG